MFGRGGSRFADDSLCVDRGRGKRGSRVSAAVVAWVGRLPAHRRKEGDGVGGLPAS